MNGKAVAIPIAVAFLAAACDFVGVGRPEEHVLAHSVPPSQHWDGITDPSGAGKLGDLRFQKRVRKLFDAIQEDFGAIAEQQWVFRGANPGAADTELVAFLKDQFTANSAVHARLRAAHHALIVDFPELAEIGSGEAFRKVLLEAAIAERLANEPARKETCESCFATYNGTMDALSAWVVDTAIICASGSIAAALAGAWPAGVYGALTCAEGINLIYGVRSQEALFTRNSCMTLYCLQSSH